MSMKYLGDRFDIHTGGTDLRFPHHEDEIAQSRGRGRPPGRRRLGPRRPPAPGGAEDREVHRQRRACPRARGAGDRSAGLPLAHVPDPLPQRDGLHLGRDGGRRPPREAAPAAHGRVGARPPRSSARRRAAFDERFREAVADDLDLPAAVVVVNELVHSRRRPRRREVRAARLVGPRARPRPRTRGAHRWEPTAEMQALMAERDAARAAQGLRHERPDPRRARRDGPRGHGHGRGHEGPPARLDRISRTTCSSRVERFNRSTAVGGDRDDVLDPHAEPPLQVDPGLDRERHAGLE